MSMTKLSKLAFENKIKYYHKGSEYEAKFYPRYFSKSFDKFKQAVITKNPGVKMEVF